ncbi:unnamed protein product [Oikopleura dioica]|uniref:Protein kinase domain-containing protein n=1 Tax=Oikopleura dioica TaxID=34765 RepID=E4YZV2_OIKDI|nr:unnamed protein product [Oikopleura dioica]
MFTEFLWLTALTLNEDEREALKGEINEWVKCFLPKLERESTRTDKCRLVASVERHEFGDDRGAFYLMKRNKCWKNSKQLQSKKKKFQNPSLSDVFIERYEIKEESGEWKLDNQLKGKLISEGGEALVFSEKFGGHEMAVRVQIFDPILFTKKLGGDQIKLKTHLISDYETAIDYDHKNDEKNNEDFVVPIHENVIRHYVNVELYDSGDVNKEDCLGWITIMEKCEGNLRDKLKRDKLDLEERKKIARGIQSGIKYLEKVGIKHKDRKLANYLLIGDVVRICDFGLVTEYSGRKSYRNLGYTRKGKKHRKEFALFAGTPGFAGKWQLGGGGSLKNNDILYLFCDWNTSWSLIYRPIDEKQRTEIDIINCGVRILKDEDHPYYYDHVIDNITKIISLPNAPDSFCLDSNLTKSYQMSNFKQQMTKCVNAEMRNLTKNTLDQKWSNLCVPISVTALLRFAMENDLAFDDKHNDYTFEQILTTLTMIVYPRSLAGLNLNPKKEEKDFQTNDIETMLERICKKTYLKESGWQIVREQGNLGPVFSECEFKNVILNENFVFSHPLTVTGAFLLPDDTVCFHQMVLDRVDDLTNEYVIQNSDFQHGGPVLRIPKTREYYVCDHFMLENRYGQGEFKYYGSKGEFMWLDNENVKNTMKPNRWYLLPQAYSIILNRLEDSSDSDSSEQSSPGSNLDVKLQPAG